MPKKTILALSLFILIAGSAMAIFGGNPSGVTPFEKLGMSAEFDYEKWMIRYDVGPDYRLNSQRLMLKPTLGILRYVEMHGLFGMSDLNIPSVSSAYTDFNGSQELAFGLGLKTHFALFYPAFGCRRISKNPVKLYSGVTWLTTKSSDDVIFVGGVRHYVVSYRFQQFDLGIYGSWQFGKTVPYVGIKWTNIIGRKYRKGYLGSSDEPFTRMSGLFNDPGQYPKPVVGLDIGLGKGYVISLEANYWGKSETSIGIGLSQIYVPKRDDESDDQAIEKPD